MKFVWTSFHYPPSVFSAWKKIVFCYISLVPSVVAWSKTVKGPSLTLLVCPERSAKDAVLKVFTSTFIIALKRPIFPFPLAHTGSGILSHSCHRLDRPLSLQGDCISRLHPCSSHFSIEDYGSMLLLKCWYPLLRCMVLQPRCSAEEIVFISQFSIFQTFGYKEWLLVYLPHYNLKSMRRNSLLWLKYCLSFSRSASFQCGQSSSIVCILWILCAYQLQQTLGICCTVVCRVLC